MADKDYGSILTRYLDPSETGFDTVVYQGGKPILDSEFVLGQEIQNSGRSALIRQTTPSGWFTGDFDKDANVDFDFRGDANTFYLINKPVVNVNGWVIPLEYSNTSTPGENEIQLSAPPSGSGNIAADFVYLEVWRSLVGPNPSTDNKPSADKIYRHGNIQSLTGEWLDDDLIDPDPAINTESTKRVQIQYRIKAVRMTDHGNREGYTDADTYAQGPNGSDTAFDYTPSSGDSGMWVAGDGNPENSLNTVDGYVYSIPLCMVFRRNSADFHYTTNGSGGASLSSGNSDRPDGLYADEIVFDDVLDLRRQVTLQGFNWGHKLERNTSMLMDQTLRSWTPVESHLGWELGGQNSTSSRPIKADTLNHGGNGDTSGDDISRDTDGICPVFSDRAISKTHIEAYSKGSDWTAGDTLTLNLPAEVPSGTVINDVRIVVQDVGQIEVPVTSVTGLGSGSATITIGNPSVASSRDIWVSWVVSYPSGGGLRAHVSEPASNFQVNVHNPTNFNPYVGTTFTPDAAGRLAVREYVWVGFEQGPHREVGVYYTTDGAVTLSVVSKDKTTVVLPEFLFEDASGTTKGVVSVESLDNPGSQPPTVDTETAGRMIKLSSDLPSANETVEVTYFPKRPIPAGVGGVSLYYMTPGIQAVNYEYLQKTDPEHKLRIKPVCVSPYLYVGTAGSGAQLTPFPYEAPMNQVPVHINQASSGDFRGEHELNTPGDISIDDFDANTGFLRLPVMVPMAPVDHFTLKDPAEDADVYGLQVDHYTNVDMTEYRPSAIAQSLSTVVGHKCFLPIIAQLEEDTDFARAGEHILVVFANYVPDTEENRIGFTDEDGDTSKNTTCAAVYRLKGSPVTY